jgi:hypothetical protein
MDYLTIAIAENGIALLAKIVYFIMAKSLNVKVVVLVFSFK